MIPRILSHFLDPKRRSPLFRSQVFRCRGQPWQLADHHRGCIYSLLPMDLHFSEQRDFLIYWYLLVVIFPVFPASCIVGVGDWPSALCRIEMSHPSRSWALACTWPWPWPWLGWSLMIPNGCSSQLAPSHVIETHQIQKIFQEYEAHSRFCRFGFIVSGRKQIKTPGQHKHHKPTDQLNWNPVPVFWM